MAVEGSFAVKRVQRLYGEGPCALSKCAPNEEQWTKTFKCNSEECVTIISTVTKSKVTQLTQLTTES